MKRSVVLLLLLMHGFITWSQQDYWVQREQMSVARIGAMGVGVDTVGFAGLGRDANQVYLKDLWMYDPAVDMWTQRANYPGGGSYSLSAAAVNGMVYMGLGYSGTHSQTDWWRYNPASNMYTQLASFPGPARYGASTFVIGNKVYVVAGSPGGVPYYQDCYVYDITSNSWSQIADFGGGLRNHTNAFSYGGKGYVACGTKNLSTSGDDLWEYDPVLNAWTILDTMPGSLRTAASHFQVDNFFYICAGYNNLQSSFLVDLWEYNILDHTWTQRTDFPSTGRYFAIAFSIDGFGYFGTGGTLNMVEADFWKYYPAICRDSIHMQPLDQYVVGGDTAVFTVSYSSWANTYRWQSDMGMGFIDLSEAGQYSGVQTQVLKVAHVNWGNQNQLFRCIVADAYGCIDTSDVASITIDITGIEDSGNGFVIDLFPNPSSGRFTVSSPAMHSLKTIEVFSLEGRLLQTTSLQHVEAINLDLTGLGKGMFLLRFTTDTGLVMTQKVVVM